MALGAMVSVGQSILPGGPQFIDRVTVVGDAAYPNTGGTIGSLGLQALLRALRKDNRAIISVTMYKCTSVSKYVRYDAAADLLTAFTDTGTPAMETNASDLSGVTYSLEIISQ